jgi:hypothetical protein
MVKCVERCDSCLASKWTDGRKSGAEIVDVVAMLWGGSIVAVMWR